MENLQFEEKKEYAEILSNVDCTLKVRIGLYYAYIIFWSLVTDCGFVLRIVFAQQNCEFRQCRVEIYYIILLSLHPQSVCCTPSMAAKKP